MILDTCALLWLASGSRKISRATLKRINEASAVYVSAISGFEIGIKGANGKLKLPLSSNEWFEKVVEHHDLTILPLDLKTCINSTQLPPHHNDPCDRFIIATAKLHGFAIVTADERFEQYVVEVLI